ncbi:MAG: hypothetical protein WBX22_01505 [Silvibacterium sp.]
MRRNLNKGQQAMAYAMMYPEAERGGGRGKNEATRKVQVSCGFSGERLRQAREVLHYDPELARRVLKGTRMLDHG